jgi:multisubunit Na+/H+ antiporter MnhB subunit
MTDSMFLFDAVMGLSLVGIAVGTLLAKRLFQSTVMFIFFGLIMAIAWCRLGAVDVALAEAALGSGLTGALLLNTLAAVRRHHTQSSLNHSDNRRSDDSNRCAAALPVPTEESRRSIGLLISAFTVICAGLLIPVVMPLATDESSPGIASVGSLPVSGVDNPVTAVLLNFRAYDTLLEVAVLLAAVFAVLPVTQFASGMEKTPPLGPVLATFIKLLVPLATMVATYVLWVGTKAPGGAFQAAAILAAVAVLLILAGATPPTCALRRWRLLLVIGPVVFVLAALEGMFVHRNFLEYRPQWAGITITLIEVALTVSIALILTMLFSCTLPTSNESVGVDKGELHVRMSRNDYKEIK